MADKAILFGINNYRAVSDLRGCVNDVENIEKLLVEHFGFNQKNIRSKTDRDVVLSKVTKDWKWLVKGASPGDRLVFHFSGHGSHVVDQDGDEKDGADEILCLHDMDFDDPDSYLSDDTIGKWIKEIAEGVNVTFIMDCCHSGTATRGLNVALRSGDKVSGEEIPLVVRRDTSERKSDPSVLRAARKQRSLGDDSDGENSLNPELVLARYLRPPALVEKRMRKHGTRATFQNRNSDDNNHVRFSGCKDEQTSADAYIANQFQGAFTANFCKIIRESEGSIAHNKLIGAISDSLVDQGFSQQPQLFPKNLRTNVFDGPDNSDRESAVDADNLASVLRDMRDSISGLLDLLDGSSGSLAGIERGRTSSTRSGRRSLVYVHGICWHDPGYSDPWYEAMSRHLDSDLARILNENRHEVLWSHHVSSSSRDVLPESSRSFEEQELADEISDVLRDRGEQTMVFSSDDQEDGMRSLDARDIERSLFGIPGLDCVDDFIKYLLNSSVRKKVLKEFTDVVGPLMQAGHDIDIISHSWGTVVALEGMYKLQNQSFSGQVNNLFTVGSALSIRPVQRRLKFGAESGRKPEFLDHWTNVDAKGDIVGGTLRGFPFEVDEEFLNLPPVGCNPGFFGVSASCAHGSYFKAANIKVNRDVFAGRIN